MLRQHSNVKQHTPRRITKANIGIVFKIILDESSELVETIEVEDNSIIDQDLSIIGAITFKRPENIERNLKSLELAFPYDRNVKSLPIQNEIVEIINVDGLNYYKTLGTNVTPNLTAFENNIQANAPLRESTKTSNSSYSSVFNTGISNTQDSNSSDNTNKFGEYYLPNLNIHTLKLFEGDYLIESRFGQSIRFSGYNNADREESPTILIRNRESSLSQNNIKIGGIVEEDINRDGSTIAITSNKFKIDFQPGTVSDRGKSDFKTKPDSFDKYPTDLTGDQVLIASGRLLFSAKESELIFYSKKNYGFVSDGTLSIDNAGGWISNINGDYNLNTNGNNINFVSGEGGEINLGDRNLEPLVKGNTLVKVIRNLVFLIETALGPNGTKTPAGTTQGLVNVSHFQSIKQDLNSILSDLNKTQ